MGDEKFDQSDATPDYKGLYEDLDTKYRAAELRIAEQQRALNVQEAKLNAIMLILR